MFTSDFANMKVKASNILWRIYKQTYDESGIQSIILMKSEQILAMRCIGKVILNGCAIGDVCATNGVKVTSCPINHRSADRCQQCQVHSRITVMANIIRYSINML